MFVFINVAAILISILCIVVIITIICRVFAMSVDARIDVINAAKNAAQISYTRENTEYKTYMYLPPKKSWTVSQHVRVYINPINLNEPHVVSNGIYIVLGLIGVIAIVTVGMFAYLFVVRNRTSTTSRSYQQLHDLPSSVPETETVSASSPTTPAKNEGHNRSSQQLLDLPSPVTVPTKTKTTPVVTTTAPVVATTPVPNTLPNPKP